MGKKRSLKTAKQTKAMLVYGLLMLPLAYMSDCVLDAMLFEEQAILDQLLQPSNPELAKRALLIFFILAVTLLGISLLVKATRNEQQLRSRNADLLLANQELEEFSFTLSHDLRNMLMKMYASAGLLKEQCQGIHDERIRFLIDNIALSSDQMETQIDALLNLAMIASGDLNRNEIYLDQLAREVTKGLVADHPESRISLKFTPGLKVNCDAKLMKLAFKSLFSNALKFIPEERRGLIELGRIRRQGENIYYVRDNGIGFDNDKAGQIFEHYRSPSTIDDLPGSGIGLATVRRVIQRHGGRVWAEGIPDAGATFYFTLES